MTDCESLGELWSICEEVARFEDDRPLREANCSDRNGKVIALQALAQKLIRARATTRPPATTCTTWDATKGMRCIEDGCTHNAVQGSVPVSRIMTATTKFPWIAPAIRAIRAKAGT